MSDIERDIEQAQTRFFEALDAISTRHRVTDSEFIPLLESLLGLDCAEAFENWVAEGITP